MRTRTEDEINAYIDGFNACFRMFSNYLKESSAEVAQEKMDLMVVAVNNVARKQVDYAQLD